MNALKQALWLFTALLALAGSAFYFASSKPVVQQSESYLSTTPDMIISQLIMRSFDQQGGLINQLHSSEVQHVEKGNIHLLTSPHLILNSVNQAPWEISSKQAKALGGGKQITFIHQVIAHQATNKTGQESTMRTEKLDYF